MDVVERSSAWFCAGGFVRARIAGAAPGRTDEAKGPDAPSLEDAIVLLRQLHQDFESIPNNSLALLLLNR